MPQTKRRLFDDLFRTRASKILTVVLAALVLFIIAIAVVARHAEPLLRARVIETLSTRFRSRVDLSELDVDVADGLVVSGKGLKIYGQNDLNIQKEGLQPLIGVGEFHFRTGVFNLLRSPMHVGAVELKDLELNIPSKKDRTQYQDMGSKNGKIKIIVDEFRAEKAMLVINTENPDKMPLEFDIQNLRMRGIGPNQPLQFTATLVNPKPVGNIDSHGEFGPFNSEDPRESPVRGEYTFKDADLGTLKGIGGILSSAGKYEGSLGRIVVDGKTDTPDFRLKISGRSVPLKTEFHAIVDGTTGDTYLQPVKATLLDTPFTATGYVVKSADPKGHKIRLNVVLENGKIDDLLRLAVRTDPPVMTGAVRMKTLLLITPGDPDLSDRLYLKGNFGISGAHFSNEKIQSKVDSLSMRSQGKPQQAADDVPDNVRSRMNGNFILERSVLTLPNLVFEMPGTQVTLEGVYSLDGNEFDMHGKARLDAKLSQMVKGWKSIALKPVDPFFRKNGATEVPIKITGTKSEPHFGLDLFHKKDEKPEEKAEAR